MWSSRLDKRCLTDWRVSSFIGFLLSVDTLSVNSFGEFSLISIKAIDSLNFSLLGSVTW